MALVLAASSVGLVFSGCSSENSDIHIVSVEVQKSTCTTTQCDKNPVSGATVRLESGTDAVVSATTSGEGLASLRAPSIGSYSLRIVDPSNGQQRTTEVTVGESGSVTVIFVFTPDSQDL